MYVHTCICSCMIVKYTISDDTASAYKFKTVEYNDYILTNVLVGKQKRYHCY